jgi:hypothetical protein
VSKNHTTAAAKVTTEPNQSNNHGRAAIATPVITENNDKRPKKWRVCLQNGVYDYKNWMSDAWQHII